MANGSVGMSGHTFDAFVSSQRGYNEPDWAAKIQGRYWRARQKFLATIEKKEDSCIVLSDFKLDSKLEVYGSIDRSCRRLTDILESYQNCLFVFANEENALGILLKECGKHDQTKAGKIMSITGKSLTQSSHQHIRLYMPLLRLFQEMETFHSRAVLDTSQTVSKLEKTRSHYRSSLLWMKDISEKLDPDVYKNLEKFRQVQSKVREDKRAFDSMQMDVVQKIDLLMASRCNLMNQVLAPYQSTLLNTFEKNQNNFKSVEELIKSEDLYEYEFKTLKQLNPLRIDESNPNTNNITESEDQNQDLIGNFDDAEGPSNKLSSRHAAERDESSVNLIGVSNLENEIFESGTQSSLSVAQTEDELANSLHLLDTLFGDGHESSHTEVEEPGKSRRREDDIRAIRCNLTANLLDVDDSDEDKQVASLLGLSERTSSQNKDATNALGSLRGDIFSKWEKERGSTDEAAERVTNDNLDQDLMDIGGVMPKTAGRELDDFFA